MKKLTSIGFEKFDSSKKNRHRQEHLYRDRKFTNTYRGVHMFEPPKFTLCSVHLKNMIKNWKFSSNMMGTLIYFQEFTSDLRGFEKRKFTSDEKKNFTLDTSYVIVMKLNLIAKR